MTAIKNREPADNGRGVAQALSTRRSFKRIRLVLWAIAVGGIVVGAHYVWSRVREHVAARDDYRLTARDISITAPPAWIRADVKAEVIRNSGLATEPLSILDDGLVERIHRAFSLHPWVAKVERVSKSHPARVEVEIVYRRPVAMVEVPGGHFPVDAEGVVLPSEDFSPLEVRSYPQLSGIESSPLGPTGTKWGDSVVAGGARIAETLRPNWEDLGLRAVHWAKPTASSDPSAPALFELITSGGNIIPWGGAPGSESGGEPNPQEKIVRLKGYIATHGSLDKPQGGPRDLDLRRSDSAPRTASRPN